VFTISPNEGDKGLHCLNVETNLNLQERIETAWNEPYREGLCLAGDVSVLWKDRQTLPEHPAHPWTQLLRHARPSAHDF
jgi:hypothetical protein